MCLDLSQNQSTHVHYNLKQWIRYEAFTYFNLERPERKTQAHIRTVLKTCFCPQTVDAIVLQMCLERLEPRVEHFQEASRRQEWCDSVLPLKVPLETIIRKESSDGEALIGEKTKNILTQCRFIYVFTFFLNYLFVYVFACLVIWFCFHSVLIVQLVLRSI